MKLPGAAILVSRGLKVLQAAPAAYPYRSAKEENAHMRRFEVLLIIALVIPHLAGCGRETPTPSPGSQSDPGEKPLRARIVGKWITNTDPEQRGSATMISFLETGEFQSSGLAKFNGQTLTVEKDGKKELLRVTMSGSAPAVPGVASAQAAAVVRNSRRPSELYLTFPLTIPAPQV
jgi:hypothetical protein